MIKLNFWFLRKYSHDKFSIAQAKLFWTFVCFWYEQIQHIFFYKGMQYDITFIAGTPLSSKKKY